MLRARLSTAEARRIALAAQGFAEPRRADGRAIRRLFDRVALVQIDGLNVLSRAHYLPGFARLGPQCSLAVQLRRATGAVIGRSAELDAIAQELREASGRLAAVTLEGEPGIGKTRLLLAAAELASAAGFTCVAITADEEIRGPFLVARSLFASAGDPRDGRRDAGGGRRPARGRGDLGPRRARVREPVAGREAPAGVRPRGRRDRRRSPGSGRSRCSSTTSSGPTTTPCGCSGTSSGATPIGRSSCS